MDSKDYIENLKNGGFDDYWDALKNDILSGPHDKDKLEEYINRAWNLYDIKKKKYQNRIGQNDILNPHPMYNPMMEFKELYIIIRLLENIQIEFSNDLSVKLNNSLQGCLYNLRELLNDIRGLIKINYPNYKITELINKLNNLISEEWESIFEQDEFMEECTIIDINEARKNMRSK